MSQKLFSFLTYLRLAKNPLFEVESLHGPTGPLTIRGSNIGALYNAMTKTTKVKITTND